MVCQLTSFIDSIFVQLYNRLHTTLDIKKATNVALVSISPFKRCLTNREYNYLKKLFLKIKLFRIFLNHIK